MGSQKGVPPYWRSAVYMKVIKSLADSLNYEKNKKVKKLTEKTRNKN